MPKYDRAVAELPVEQLFAELRGGISVKDLLSRLEQRGIDRRTAKLVIQAQIDAGRICLGERMKLVHAREPEAA